VEYSNHFKKTGRYRKAIRVGSNLKHNLMKKSLKNVFVQNKLKFFSLFLFGALTTLVLNSCAKEDAADVNQDKIWTEYLVHYNENDDKTHVVARFRFGNAMGTLLELVDTTGASVSFNGTPMPYSIFWSGHHLEFAGNVTTGTFDYVNTEGTVYSNSVPSGTDVIAFPSDFDTIAKSQAETFTWVGNPLSANQSVGIYVGSYGWNKDALFYTNAVGANSLVMGVQAKNSLTVGTGGLYMLRVVENNSINGTSKGGVIRYSYRPIDKSVVIVP